MKSTLALKHSSFFHPNFYPSTFNDTLVHWHWPFSRSTASICRFRWYSLTMLHNYIQMLTLNILKVIFISSHFVSYSDTILVVTNAPRWHIVFNTTLLKGKHISIRRFTPQCSYVLICIDFRVWFCYRHGSFTNR